MRPERGPLDWWRHGALIGLVGLALGILTMTKPTVVAAEKTATAEPVTVSDVVLAIHGGIGVGRAEMTADLDKQLRAALEAALRTGEAALARPDATSLDAVEAAVRSLEDSPLFNAGRGAVFTHEGRNELDASIMDGRTRRAGAVAGVTIVRNPITAARAVMERSPHVLLIGRGAEVFATQQGLEIVDPSYFWTEHRWRDIQRRWEQDGTARPAPSSGSAIARNAPYFGTVGAVARDRGGNLAAATSTGGMTNKSFGRVGDSPIIGAGTYADNVACAVSCTGHGEYFIRLAVAHTITMRMKFKAEPVATAASQVIQGELLEAGGEGGAIVLDRSGNYVGCYNTEGMYRGYLRADGTVRVMLYDN